MFLVVNKEKFMSYLVAFSTVAILIGVSATFAGKNETVQTTSRVINQTNNTNVSNNQYNE